MSHDIENKTSCTPLAARNLVQTTKLLELQKTQEI
jgi:hypothetical protein